LGILVNLFHSVPQGQAGLEVAKTVVCTPKEELRNLSGSSGVWASHSAEEFLA
jgi:hypothetical protein